MEAEPTSATGELLDCVVLATFNINNIQEDPYRYSCASRAIVLAVRRSLLEHGMASNTLRQRGSHRHGRSKGLHLEQAERRISKPKRSRRKNIVVSVVVWCSTLSMAFQTHNPNGHHPLYTPSPITQPTTNQTTSQPKGASRTRRHHPPMNLHHPPISAPYHPARHPPRYQNCHRPPAPNRSRTDYRYPVNTANSALHRTN